jgi:hypothetical protein
MKVTAFLSLTLRREFSENIMACFHMLPGKCDLIKESWRAHLNGIGQSFCQAKIYLNARGFRHGRRMQQNDHDPLNGNRSAVHRS